MMQTGDQKQDRRTPTQEQLVALVAHLEGRRPVMLEAWRAAVDNDPDLTTGSGLSRTQFQDHIPDILDSFARRLRAWPDDISITVQQQEHQGIISHGLHRWQQGFRLRELTREWGYLQLCVVDEVEAYGKAHPDLEVTVIATALRALTHLCVAGVSDSAEEYWQLHQAEATGHVRDLEQALSDLNSIESARATGWHQAAHDLRGSLSVISMASEILNAQDVDEPVRLQGTTVLQKSVSSLHEMLNNLLDLARLEAGQERRTIAPFDAAVFLRDFCLTLQPVAQAQGLSLTCEGPDELAVEGDRAKVGRIVQNLVLNALKYTAEGGVVVQWESRKESDAQRWMVSVQDTGPGFTSSTSVMSNHLWRATQESHDVENAARTNGTSSNHDEPAVTQSSQSPASSVVSGQGGEGIGFSIVKGLCDLLDATLELETQSGQGSTFRVTFPCNYPS